MPPSILIPRPAPQPQSCLISTYNSRDGPTAHLDSRSGPLFDKRDIQECKASLLASFVLTSLILTVQLGPNVLFPEQAIHVTLPLLLLADPLLAFAALLSRARPRHASESVQSKKQEQLAQLFGVRCQREGEVSVVFWPCPPSLYSLAQPVGC